MTEQEWLECVDPTPMLGYLQGKASDRKLGLFACACCRRIFHLIVHPVSRAAVDVAERFSDGLATDEERDRIYGEADDIRCLLGGVGTGDLEQDVEEEFGGIIEAASITPDVAAAAADEAWGCAEPEPEHTPGIGASAAEAVANFALRDAEISERAAQTMLLRDMIGNPFRPTLIDPVWLTPSLTSHAAAAYQERSMPSGELDPTCLAILADALEEAGCDNEDILNHLRQPGVHVRGCWVVDLILGKE